MTEAELHKNVCQYIRMQYPNVLFNVDMSGIKLTMGQAKKVSILRSSKGWPDIFIPEPKKFYHGLYIELKKDGEKLCKKNGDPATDHIKDQMEMIQNLRERGYAAEFAIGFDQAKKAIDYYMNLR
jgi:hypothetical protein